ncbi:hypothetical protein [Rubellimicrobium roseum]|uniref:hypothetical protein n=1 Tax=Rubellimicrobium roseum TaxID=687525 RepID=UPI00159BA16D|nr:hypothetical protein [Rubellimicrobium roseum]
MRSLLPLLLLAACAEFPVLDARIPAAERAAPPPPLVPLDGVLAQAEAVPPSAPAGDLAARAQAVSARASALPAPAASNARLADLAVRAQALREGGLSEAERARLGASGPSLP